MRLYGGFDVGLFWDRLGFGFGLGGYEYLDIPATNDRFDWI
jgi:hypothetical protein